MIYFLSYLRFENLQALNISEAKIKHAETLFGHTVLLNQQRKTKFDILP